MSIHTRLQAILATGLLLHSASAAASVPAAAALFRPGPPSAAAPLAIRPADAGGVQPALPALKGLRAYRQGRLDASVQRRLEGFARGSFRLDLGKTGNWDLELEPVSVRAPGYVVRHLDSRGITTVAPAPERAFRGRLRGRPGSEVFLSFQDGQVTGFLREAEGSARHFIEPLARLKPGAATGTHVVYRDEDVVPEPGISCGLASPGHGAIPLPTPGSAPTGPAEAPFPGGEGDAFGMGDLEIPAPRALAKPAAEPCALADIAIAVDYSMVKGLGSAAAVEKRINDIYHLVDGLYRDSRVNIGVRISEIIIETEPRATWGATMDINAYLNNLTSWMVGANGFKKPFDVGALWYYQLGGGTVGLAWVGVVCGGRRSKVVRYFTPTTRSLVIDAAHELGHNFNAPHISNPQWIMNPSITGSNDKWDASTIGTIVAHKKSRTCLAACQVAPTAAFAVAGPSACAETRSFTDRSSGEPTSWLWEFGDGQSSRERNPAHTYATPGRYTVRLSAGNAYGADTATQGNIRVQPLAPPAGTDAEGCVGSSLVLAAEGPGLIRWYDTTAGGAPLAAGPTFTTPALARTKTYYAETGEPDAPISKVGPADWKFGTGQFFTANGDRRLFFDVSRPAVLVSAKVNAGSAGPRRIEILDAKDARVATKVVNIPAGESRISLDLPLEPGRDWALKVVGGGDSANLYRNAAGADYPYTSPDTLVTITGSDAVTGDSVTQAGYYYFFYDWEIRERGCASPRTPVTARINCSTDLLASASHPFSAALRPAGPGRLRLEGHAPAPGPLTAVLRTPDGRTLHRLAREVAAGPFYAELALPDLPATVLLVEIRLGNRTLRGTVPRM